MSLLFAACACCQDLLTKPALAKLLEGSVEHSENLEPVDPSLRAGTQYTRSPVNKPSNYSDSWVQIPKWMAGNWHSDLSSIEGAPASTRPFVSDRMIGDMADAEGGTWTHVQVPQNHTTESDTFYTVHKVILDSYLKTSDKKVIEQSREIKLRVNKETRVIESSYQQEAIMTSTPTAPDKMTRRSSNVTFDENGQRTGMYISRTDFFRTGPFEATTDPKVRSSFKDFLTSRGLSRLIPENL